MTLTEGKLFKNLFLCELTGVKNKGEQLLKAVNLKLFHILNLCCISIDQNTNNGSTSGCNTVTQVHFFSEK